MHKILYIGNNLSKTTKYPTALNNLVAKLKQENFDFIISSNKSNKILRLLDMIFTTFKNRKKIDIVFIDTYSTSNFYYALIISQLSRFFKLKYIPILHGGNLPYRLDNNPYLSKLIFKNSFINVAPSNYLKTAFQKKDFETKFIPNAINIFEYNFKERKELQPKLFWVRAFKEIYNPILALKALSELKKEYTNATLCMVGPFIDDSYNDCLAFTKNNNLEDSVEFTNLLSKEDWHKKSKNFDIFINTTNIDNTPVSVVEAMALGLTIASTNVGGIPFLIDDKKNGVLVEPNNPTQMKNAIVSILEDKNSKLSLSARKKVEMFDWNVAKNKWLEILK
ncbi:MAG: glycosyltransferase family 4 protein [Polaribacter sp.]